MTLFQGLDRSSSLPSSPDGSLGTRQSSLDAHFADAVSDSPLRLWSPGDPIAQQGNRLLLGVATWSPSDMKLLDAVSQALQGRPPALVVEVFNVADCHSLEDFARYVPGIGSVFQTPVVGLWSDGNLVDKVTGKAARDLAARVLGLESEQLAAT